MKRAKCAICGTVRYVQFMIKTEWKYTPYPGKYITYSLSLCNKGMEFGDFSKCILKYNEEVDYVSSVLPKKIV